MKSIAVLVVAVVALAGCHTRQADLPRAPGDSGASERAASTMSIVARGDAGRCRHRQLRGLCYRRTAVLTSLAIGSRCGERHRRAPSAQEKSRPGAGPKATPLPSTAPSARTEVKQGRFRGLQFGKDIKKQLPKCPLSFPRRTCWSGSDGSDVQVEFVDNLSFMFLRVIAEQHQNMLVRLILTFPLNRIDELVSLLTAKYGDPSELQSGASAIRIWSADHLLLQMAAPAVEIDSGLLTVEDPGLAAEFDKAEETRKEQERRKQLDDL